MEIIGIMHVLFSLIGLSYAFIIPKNWIDLYYLLGAFLVALSWTLFKGECIITVLYKKYKDPNYQIGENKTLDDVIGIFGQEYESYVPLWIKFIMALQSYTIYLVLIRNQLNGWYAILYFFYILGLSMTTNIFYQGFSFFLFLYILIKIIHKLWK